MAMLPWWIHYPNVNNEIINLDWILQISNENTDTIKNFIGVNTIKYADPILWDITSQYEANTIVVDPQNGDAYISTKAVPYGVALSNEGYWTRIYNYASEIHIFREQIAYDEQLSTTATAPRSVDDLVFLNGLLYIVTAPMIAGDSYVVGSNCAKTTINAQLLRLHTSINAEAQAREDADTALGGRIDGEIQAREDADTALGGRIDTEAQAREDGDTALGGRIDGEIQAREDADDALRTLIENHVQFITPQKFGAIGDGVADDTTAVQDFINACLQGEVGFVPEGTYLCTSQIVVDFSTANVRELKIFGAGSYRSVFKSTLASGVAFLFTSNTLFDSFHTVLNDLMFTSIADITLQIGKDDYSDSQGNYNFTNVTIANTSNRSNSVAARYNYLFDCVFTNCIYLCNAQGKGTSLELRLCCFCTFIGGSYSNGNIGIHFTGSTSHTLTFIGSDFENLNYGVYISTAGQYIKFITCYFDIWRPDLNPPTYGINAVYSELANFASTGLFIFDNCLFTRAGIYGSGGIDINHIFGCKFIGNYSYPGPAQPTGTPATYLNSSGMDLICYAWVTNTDTGAIMSYTVEGDTFQNLNTDVQCGQTGVSTITVRVPVGATIKVNYTGTIYWCFRPLNT